MDKNTEGRVPIDIIEIDLDYCEWEYGDSNCLADLEVDRHKCFNTLATCGAVDNYSPETKTYRFCTDQTDIPTDNVYFPFIASVSVSPGKINPLGADKSTSTLGKRITLNATFTDHPSSDRYVDKYQRERIIGTAQFDGVGYNPFDRSTFWRKFKARNPYYKNRVVRYISGYIEDGVVSDSITQTFILTNISDSDSAGRITLEAKDPLYLAQREKALAPEPSEGKLSAGINNSVTSFTLSPSGIGNANYSASGYIRIDSEVMSFTRTGDAMTIVRGQYNTTAAAHDADAAVQECLQFSAQLPYQILTTLLEDYAGIASGYLDTTQWFDESVTRNNLPQAYSALITEPTEVEKLLNEMVEQMYFYVWYSSREGKVKIRAVRPIQDDDVTELNYDEHLMGQMSVNEDASKMVTRVVVNYAMIDPTKNLDELTNFSATEVNVSLDLESDNQYRDKKTKVINSRWMGSGSGGAAQTLAQRVLYRLSKPLRSFGFSLDAKDRDLWLSDFIAIRSPFVVDSIGEELPVNAHIIQAQESATGSIYSYTAEEYVYNSFDPVADEWITLIRAASGTAGNANVNLRDWWDDEFPATPPTASDKIRFIIEENVIMNATTTAGHAIELLSADFPSGCELRLEIRPNAWVVGKGGSGGLGGTSANGGNGSAGGDAMLLEFPITIVNQGVIGGGGGGGGGGGAVYEGATTQSPRISIAGAGGGGGGGYGTAGVAGTSVNRARFGGITTLPSNGGSGTLTYGSRGASGFGSMIIGSTNFSFITTSATSGRGGNGGALGQSGAAGAAGTYVSKFAPNPIPPTTYTGGTGGAAGKAIDGVSFVTWEVQGDIRGAMVG